MYLTSCNFFKKRGAFSCPHRITFWMTICGSRKNPFRFHVVLCGKGSTWNPKEFYLEPKWVLLETKNDSPMGTSEEPFWNPFFLRVYLTMQSNRTLLYLPISEQSWESAETAAFLKVSSEHPRWINTSKAMQRQMDIIAPNKPIQRQQPNCQGLYLAILSGVKLFQEHFLPSGEWYCIVPSQERVVQ